MTAQQDSPLRVLVVDDSPFNRHLIGDAVSEQASLLVVGHASNGEQALRMVTELSPDVITLDIEMPKMDGFTFLRILNASRPTPVIVVSSHTAAESVFRALELGATDFVAKPSDGIADRDRWKEELLSKIVLCRFALRKKRHDVAIAKPRPSRPTRAVAAVEPPVLVTIASSTGGPSALLHILSRIPGNYPGSIVIAQHMAASFTKTFAQRLDRTTPLHVREAHDGEIILPGHAYICPGGTSMTVARSPYGLQLRRVAPTADDRYVPSGNRVMSSAAEVMGPRVLGLVLTGMADDGVVGARDIRRAGGTVICESPETAIVNGMPGAVSRAGHASQVLPLDAIVDAILAFA